MEFSTSSAAVLTSDERYLLVSQAAYYRAERRGFIPGFELDDWYAAEAEVDRALVMSR